MSPTADKAPPHYLVHRVLWIVLQVAVLLGVVAVLLQQVPPGELLDDVRDAARDLQSGLF